ncbi:MAG: diguanylate cyclase [Ruminococcus sp.]|nr:diguanylate cyclase [Ruminococcus sp.]HRR77396.1 cache domain-containing protein [Ruminococcus sp.]
MNEKRFSKVALLLALQFIIMIILSVIITMTISKTTRRNSIEHMETIADERAHIILNYVENAENTLTYYSKAQQVLDLLNDPTDPEAIKKAQAFTEDYSASIDNVEGLWIGEWNTHCIAHTNPGTVGITTRKDPDKLKELQDAMLAAGDKVYNTGMILSPATGKQIVSMYKAVYDENGQPIGFVGLGIFTDKLINSLNSLSIKGLDDVSYSMVNVNDGKYVFNDDPDLVYTVADNGDISKICSDLKGTSAEKSGSFEYKSGNKKYISIYTYIPEYGWILMLDDTKSEIYSLTNVMRVYMVIFGIAILALLAIFSFINKKQQKTNQKLASTIVKNNKTKESLYTAMFKDVLTDVNNRVAFSMNLEEFKASREAPFYFAMFNISDFSEINTKYGNDTGDWVLVKTVDIISQIFKNSKIYRTGSDEFIVAIQADNSSVSADVVLSNVNDAYRKLSAQQNTPMGKISFSYKASVVKKSSDINTSVITVLKDMMNKDPEAVNGHITYTDMDQM